VFTVENNRVHTVPVRIMAESDTAVAVKGDLKPGRTVVLGSDSLLMRLSDGITVAPAGEIK